MTLILIKLWNFKSKTGLITEISTQSLEASQQEITSKAWSSTALNCLRINHTFKTKTWQTLSTINWKASRSKSMGLKKENQLCNNLEEMQKIMEFATKMASCCLSILELILKTFNARNGWLITWDKNHITKRKLAWKKKKLILI